MGYPTRLDMGGGGTGEFGMAQFRYLYMIAIDSIDSMDDPIDLIAMDDPMIQLNCNIFLF